MPRFDGPPPNAHALPGGSSPASAGPRQTYDYENPAEWLRDRPQPESYEVAAALLSPRAEVPGTWERCLKRWQDYQLDKAGKLAAYNENPVGKKPSAMLPWHKWLRQYIPNQGNDNQGNAFRMHVAERLRLGSNFGWQTESYVPGVNRYYDLANEKLGLYYEVKSGRGIDKSELTRDKAFIEAERDNANPRKLVYIFPEEPTEAAKAALRDAGIPYFVVSAQKNLISRGGADPGGAKSDDPKSGSGSGSGSEAVSPDDILRAPNQYQAAAAAPSNIAESGDTAEEAAELREVKRQLATDSGHPELAEDLGGVDFSTLELRYVSDTYHKGSGVQYAFKADASPADQESFGGRRAAQLASDSFFVWLELPPSAFTVNLNPDEPDRIIDEKFGRTDAGRVLLEADLAMKKSVAQFIHPDTAGGETFWAALQGDTKCLSMRQWIVPDTATVRDDDNELYILDAPLLVKMESDIVKAQGVGGAAGCGQQDEASTRHNEDLYRTTILPQVQEAVNHAPEYADLRRVYASRVAAEWFRERSSTKTTAYSDLIGQGDISRWASREDWTPREVFDRYVQSYKNGEFNVAHTTTEGNMVYTRTYVYGGVDFSRIDQNRVSAAAFAKDHPALPSSARESLNGPSGEGREVWLGGQTTAVPTAEAFAGPVPATSKPLFYALVALPLTAWLVTGGVLLRRRRVVAATGARP
ncbi:MULTISPECIES: hypothetical protein [unclassified Streptomyces]|uniref:hypothetical protein n=1 Tax=unclassified Streptomyces TaxID=2593676 RepID=UPI00131ADACE|nr:MULTISPECIES: hypothetical protein [unclassified Streptomyces]